MVKSDMHVYWKSNYATIHFYQISFQGGLREAFYGYNYHVKTNGMEKKLAGQRKKMIQYSDCLRKKN